MRTTFERVGVPLATFGIAVLLACLAGPAGAMLAPVRPPSEPTTCTATAVIKGGKLQIIKLDFLLTDLEIEVKANEASHLTVDPSIDVRGGAEFVHAPNPNHSFPFMKLSVELKPAKDEKDYKNAVNKVENTFTVFGAPAKDAVNSLKKEVQRLRKEYPEHKNAPVILTFGPSFWTVDGTYVCKKNGQGTFTPVQDKRVNIDAQLNGQGTLP